MFFQIKGKNIYSYLINLNGGRTMTRFFLFLLGFGLSVVGFIYIISYLNLFARGYNFLEYAHFTSRRIECLIGPIGLIMIFLSIYIPGGKKDELHL